MALKNLRYVWNYFDCVSFCNFRDTW